MFVINDCCRLTHDEGKLYCWKNFNWLLHRIFTSMRKWLMELRCANKNSDKAKHHLYYEIIQPGVARRVSPFITLHQNSHKKKETSNIHNKFTSIQKDLTNRSWLVNFSMSPGNVFHLRIFLFFGYLKG